MSSRLLVLGALAAIVVAVRWRISQIWMFHPPCWRTQHFGAFIPKKQGPNRGFFLCPFWMFSLRFLAPLGFFKEGPKEAGGHPSSCQFIPSELVRLKGFYLYRSAVSIVLPGGLWGMMQYNFIRCFCPSYIYILYIVIYIYILLYIYIDILLYMYIVIYIYTYHTICIVALGKV